jgi:hypothetical protein
MRSPDPVRKTSYLSEQSRGFFKRDQGENPFKNLAILLIEIPWVENGEQARFQSECELGCSDESELTGLGQTVLYDECFSFGG